MTKLEESLFNALAFVERSKLPPIWDGKSLWIRALCQVRKADNLLWWCYMERGDDGKPKVIRDFGSVSAIIEVVSIYPVSYLEQKYLRTFKEGEEEKMKNYLKKCGVDMDYDSADRASLDKAVTILAVKLQLKEEKARNNIKFNI